MTKSYLFTGKRNSECLPLPLFTSLSPSLFPHTLYIVHLLNFLGISLDCTETKESSQLNLNNSIKCHFKPRNSLVVPAVDARAVEDEDVDEVDMDAEVVRLIPRKTRLQRQELQLHQK